MIPYFSVQMRVARPAMVTFSVIAIITGLLAPLATMADEERDFNDRDNILIADQFNNCVIEIERRTHKIVWQFGNSSDKPGPSRALSH